MSRCRHCREDTAEPGALCWPAALLLALNLDLAASNAYCRECAGGINFMTWGVLLAFLAVCFVIAVALF